MNYKTSIPEKITMKTLCLLALILIGTKSIAQIEKPVKWEFAVQKTSQTEAIVYIKATIKDGWHIYSLDTEKGGPVKTSFQFDRSPDYTLIGKTSQPVPQARFEKAFNSKVTYFEKSVVFNQKVRLNSAKGILHGKVEYMTCNDLKCLPPDDFEFSINL